MSAATTTVMLPTTPSAQQPADPKPVSAALQRHFDEVLGRIQTGRTGQADFAVTTEGVEASVGAKKTVRVGTLSGAAYAGREWGGGWLAGGRVSWAF